MPTFTQPPVKTHVQTNVQTIRNRIYRLSIFILITIALAASTLTASAQSPLAPTLPATTSTPAPATKTDPVTQTWLTEVFGAGATKEIVEKYSPELTALDNDVERYTTNATNLDVGNDAMRKATSALEKSRIELRKFVDMLTPKLAAATAQREKLGPVPKDGTPETNELAAQRKTLDQEVAAFDGLIKRAEVLVVQADQSISNYNASSRKRFLSQLLQRTDHYGDVSFWSGALAAIPGQFAELFSRLASWLDARIRTSWFAIAFSLAIAAGVARGLNYMGIRLRNRSAPTPLDETAARPSLARRGTLVLQRAFLVSAPVIGVLIIFFLLGRSLDFFTLAEARFVGLSSLYLAFAAFLAAAARFAIRPRQHAERLVDIPRAQAMSAYRLLVAMIVVWLGDQILALLDQVLYPPLSLIVVRSAVVASLYAIIVGLFLALAIRMRKAPPATPGATATAPATVPRWPSWMYACTALAAVVILGALLTGYISLARFLGNQIVATGGLILVLTLVHLSAEYLSTPAPVAATADGDSASQGVLGATLSLVVGLTLDLLVLFIGVPLLLLQWGFDWAEIRGWISSVFFGFQIGGLTLSLQTIFISVGILITGIVLTRTIRNTFVRRSTHSFGNGSGVRDSISTVLTYVGFVLSVIAALSYLGVGVSNLAIIAGALSVGIGFGLQSIANNFVSGLILLAERPIKVGDWIAVGTQQGRVQKISVRSTQIRTFDRATVIVPNADLITGQVINLDHGDSVGRISIAVGASYKSDPRQVIETLREVGRANKHVIISDASPMIAFSGFGDSALDFILHVHIWNIRNKLEVETALRVGIVEAFRANAIDIPFPQRDIHVTNSTANVAIAPDAAQTAAKPTTIPTPAEKIADITPLPRTAAISRPNTP